MKRARNVLEKPGGMRTGILPPGQVLMPKALAARGSGRAADREDGLELRDAGAMTSALKAPAHSTRGASTPNGSAEAVAANRHGVTVRRVSEFFPSMLVLHHIS